MTLETHTLDAIDGARVDALVARPAAAPRGLVIVAQEIFGVNDYIRWVLQEQYARHGWLAVAPRFFDRIERGVELGYTPQTTARGRELVASLGFDAPLRDIHAARRAFGDGLRAGVVGYCWGGTVAFLAATRMGLPAVAYYGGRTVPFLHEHPQAPVLMHFGEHDPIIPPTDRERILHALPQARAYVYDAAHGFNRHGHADWREASAALALERTHAFFAEHLA
ncbi:MAG TPA: dienelactone hydrolase family protein [Burkholderiaceae bacterium]|nr:dienelactone hydrolase family protein [Burkholderiaceae bacterium]